MKEKENETGTTSQKVLRISLRQILFLVDEIEKVFPVEACALLFGRVAEKEIVLEKVVPTPNILNSADEFKFDGEEVGAALNEIEPKLIGFFHSDSCRYLPFGGDIEYMKLWVDYVWLILSTVKWGGVGAFSINKNGQLETWTIYIYKEESQSL